MHAMPHTHALFNTHAPCEGSQRVCAHPQAPCMVVGNTHHLAGAHVEHPHHAVIASGGSEVAVPGQHKLRHAHSQLHALQQLMRAEVPELHAAVQAPGHHHAVERVNLHARHRPRVAPPRPPRPAHHRHHRLTHVLVLHAPQPRTHTSLSAARTCRLLTAPASHQPPTCLSMSLVAAQMEPGLARLVLSITEWWGLLPSALSGGKAPLACPDCMLYMNTAPPRVPTSP
jgi:hypothetical protein